MIRLNTLVCVGLDPIISLIPISINKYEKLEDRIFDFLKTVIEVTADHCCAYKIQKAFFDEFDFGLILLKRIVLFIKSECPKKIIIIDCKIGDVEHTLSAYTKNLFSNIGADAIVVNPYMGNEIFDCFKKYPEKLFLVLVRTSNPGAAVIQDLKLTSGEKLWQFILKILVEKWRDLPNCIPVLSLNDVKQFAYIRTVIPDSMTIFYAGYGAQGKGITGLNSLINTQGYGLLVNSSRGILYSNDEKSMDWKNEILKNVTKMKVGLNSIKLN
ncbi:MAG: orotidine-5'-phosphate decarboxylase [Mucilaginibacter sp.]